MSTKLSITLSDPVYEWSLNSRCDTFCAPVLDVHEDSSTNAIRLTDEAEVNASGYFRPLKKQKQTTQGGYDVDLVV